MGKYCNIPNCQGGKEGFSCHRMPYKDSHQWAAFVKACPFLLKYSEKELDSKRICSKHFLPEHIRIVNNKKYLTNKAVPTLNLNPDKIFNKDVINQTLSLKTPAPSLINLDQSQSPNHEYLCVSSFSSSANKRTYNVLCVSPLTEVSNDPNSLEPPVKVVKVQHYQSPNNITYDSSIPSEVLGQSDSSISNVESTLMNKTEKLNVQTSSIVSEKQSICAKTSNLLKTCNRVNKSRFHSKSHLLQRFHAKKFDDSEKLKLRQANRVLKSRLRSVTDKLKRAKSLISSIEVQAMMKKYTLLNSYGKVVVDSQLRLAGVVPKARRYTNEEKIFALSLYKLSPKTYRFLQNHLNLPAKSTINSILINIPLRHGINDCIFQHLADIAKNKEVKDLQCVLLFDEMSINKNLFFNFHSGVIEGFEDLGAGERSDNVADKVLVFMLRGLFSPWKIPIAFYFVRGGINKYFLKRILKEILIAIFKTGFIPRVTISDQGSANVAAINSLISDTKVNILRSDNDVSSVIHYEVNGNKIYHMYDVPHLLKCFRNNFQKKNVLLGSQRAQWDYVHMLYKVDDHKGAARLTKLTDKHIYPNSFDKMKVKYAAQVFSRSVSASISLLMKAFSFQEEHNYCNTLNVNIENGLFTAEMILFINDLFDRLNCCGYEGTSLRNALSLNSGHIEFWNKALKKLHSMKFDASDSRESNPVFLRHFIHDLNTIKELWSDLKLIPGVKFLSLKRLNQDPLENFFSQIRGQGGSSTHPDCHNFVALFKTLLINNISTGKSLYANCAADNDSMLGTLSNLANREKFDNYIDDHSCQISNFDFIDTLLPCENVLQSQVVSYIAGAVCRYLFPKLNCSQCQNCKDMLLSSELNPNHYFIKSKEYNENNNKMYYPSKNLSSLVWHAIYIIERQLPKIFQVYIFPDLIKAFENLDTSWYICVDHKEIFLRAFSLFMIRIKVRQWCINFNRRMHKVDSRKKGMEMENLLNTKVSKGPSYGRTRRQSS